MSSFLYKKKYFLTKCSPRFCRPLRMYVAKETTELTKNVHSSIQEEIAGLESIVVMTPRGAIQVNFNVKLTMIDGKVLSAILDVSSTHACPICKCNSVEFNKRENFTNGKFEPQGDSLEYEISVLHCWLRFFDCLFNLSTRLNLDSKAPDYQQLVKNKKQKLQEDFWNATYTDVHYPRPATGGNSTTGNVCRVLFEKHETLADILGLDKDLVKNFSFILKALSCMRPLDCVKFKAYCRQTADIWINKYPTHKMTPSVHKVLVHSTEIMQNLNLPIGYFSEEAAEASNKIHRNNREHHSRKTSRAATLRDVFDRPLCRSDPYLSTLRIGERQRLNRRSKLPEEVEELLLKVEDQDVQVPSDLEASNRVEHETNYEMLKFLELLETYHLDLN